MDLSTPSPTQPIDEKMPMDEQAPRDEKEPADKAAIDERVHHHHRRHRRRHRSRSRTARKKLVRYIIWGIAHIVAISALLYIWFNLISPSQ